MTQSLHSLLLLALLASPVLAQDRVENQAERSESPRMGKIHGRFVYDGEPPARAPLKIQTERQSRTGEVYWDSDSIRFAKRKLTDETLIVGPDRGIQNVLIWIYDKSVPVPPVPPVRRLPEPATLTFEQGRLQPHVLAWWADHRALQLKNEDTSTTNLHWESVGENSINQTFPPNRSAMFQTRPERIPSRMKSDIYPWMQPAIVFPCAHPYFAVTDAEGYFTIAELPLGEWEFRAWHERCGWIKTDNWPKGLFRMKIESKPHDMGTIVVAPAVFGAKPQASRTVTPRPADSAKERPNWRTAGASRRAANEKDEAPKWVGNWTLRLPAGFQYAVRLVQDEDGLLDLGCDTNLTLLGTFALTKNQLQLVRSKDDGIDDFIWQLNDEGNFVLITDRTRVGARYIGAVLERSGRD